MGGLVLRQLAKDVGTSTSAIYSLFGCKRGLLEALVESAFRSMIESQAEIRPTDDPIADALNLALAYVDWASAHADLYSILFSHDSLGVAPSELMLLAREAQRPIHETIRRAIDSGAITETDADLVYTVFWAQVHGIASLSITGRIDLDRERLKTVIVAASAGWTSRS